MSAVTEAPPPPGSTGVALATGASDTATAEIRLLDDRRVSSFRLEGGPRAGAIGAAEGHVLRRAVTLAIDQGIPLVGVLATSGADVTDGVASLHAWGGVAAELARASGVVPTLVAVTGACVSGPALLLGLVDHVVMSEDATAYVSGPETAATFTGVPVSAAELGGSSVHARHSGVPALVVPGDEVQDSLALLLSYAPSNSLEDPPCYSVDDPVERASSVAASSLPERPEVPYDVRAVVGDVFDRESVLELRPDHAPNIVTALARLGGRPLGVVANQPGQRAGTLDIDASRKAARFVAWCDAFNLPLVTFVDTPGFEPGRDLEWQGLIRHGAQLVHAYTAASVPRLCVILRKAYGGAYIVMDSRGIGNDWCCAWPQAEIAVMGARGAVEILHRRRLATLTGEESTETRDRLEQEYASRFLAPWPAADRGLVDQVIDPTATRRVLHDALVRLATKREPVPDRRHSNTPL